MTTKKFLKRVYKHNIGLSVYENDSQVLFTVGGYGEFEEDGTADGTVRLIGPQVSPIRFKGGSYPYNQYCYAHRVHPHSNTYYFSGKFSDGVFEFVDSKSNVQSYDAVREHIYNGHKAIKLHSVFRHDGKANLSYYDASKGKYLIFGFSQ